MKNWKYFKESLIINYKSWIALLISSYLVCDYNLFTGIYNYIIGMLYIYFGHIFYHSPLSTFYYYIHTYHHDHTDNNSILFEVVMEFVGTMMPIVVIYLLYKCERLILGFNPYVYLFFALFYSTVHIFNYTLLRYNNTHMEHHININGNYFPDICDLLFNTKHNPSDVENTDHWIPNIIAVTLFVLFAKNCYRKYKNKEFLKLLFFIIYGLMYDSIIIFGIYYYIKDLLENDILNKQKFENNIYFIRKKIHNNL